MGQLRWLGYQSRRSRRQSDEAARSGERERDDAGSHQQSEGIVTLRARGMGGALASRRRGLLCGSALWRMFYLKRVFEPPLEVFGVHKFGRSHT